MSCFIMNNEPLATIACGISKVLNMGYEFSGISAPESLHNAFKDCADNYDFFDVKEIFSTLYCLNLKAYSGRYSEPFTAKTPVINVTSYNIFKCAEYADRHFTIEQWHYKYAKLLECYIYQINEDATRKNQTTIALQEFLNCFYKFIVQNSSEYESEKWGEL